MGQGDGSQEKRLQREGADFRELSVRTTLGEPKSGLFRRSESQKVARDRGYRAELAEKFGCRLGSLGKASTRWSWAQSSRDWSPVQ